MRVYQQVIDMGDGGLEAREKLVGCTLEEGFALLSAGGFCPPIVHRPENGLPARAVEWAGKR